jgi:SAM-dependent methyltransferase
VSISGEMSSRWELFFRASFGELQRGGLRDELATGEVDFLEEALRLAPPSRLLDVPCGAGRHAVELACRGYSVTGVDLNSDVIAAAQSRSAARGLAVDLRLGDMRRLDNILEREVYDAAFCFWGSFGYFDDAGNRRFLDGIRAALAPGGRLLVDIAVVETLLPRFEPHSDCWVDLGTKRVRVIEERNWNLDAGRVETDWFFIQDDVVTGRHATSIRIYGYRELRDLLTSVGLVVERTCETGTGAPPSIGGERISMICRKAAA